MHHAFTAPVSIAWGQGEVGGEGEEPTTQTVTMATTMAMATQVSKTSASALSTASATTIGEH